MSPQSLPADGARSGASARAGANVRRRQDSPTDKLQRLSSRLDVLIRDVSIGARSHREHEQHVEEAEAIGAELRAVFRLPTSSQNRPRWQDGGKAIW